MTDGSSVPRLRPGQRTLLALLLMAVVAVPAAIHAWRTPVWVYPDPDFILAYNALVLSAWLPQEFFDHTGYVYLLLLAGWYQVLHTVGAIGAHTISALPSMQDRAAFDAAWTGVIQAGRAFGIFTAAGFVLAFAWLVARWKEDWRLGLLAGLLLAGAAGTMSQAYYLRTELISTWFVVLTLFCVVFAPRQPTIERQLGLLAAAGLCAVLAIATKVFAIIPLLAVPVLAFALTEPGNAARPERGAVSARTAAVVAVVLALTAVPAALIVSDAVSQFAKQQAYPYTPVMFGTFGAYQALVVAGVVLAMALYSMLRHVPRTTALCAVAAAAAGVAAGVLVLAVKYHPANVAAILSPVEHMYVFSVWANQDLAKEANVLSGGLAGKLMGGIRALLHQRLMRTPNNMIVLEWLTLIGLAFGWRDRGRRWMWQAFLLLGVAWGLQTIFALRQPVIWYFGYSDPFVILAAVVVAARWSDFVLGRARIATAVVVALHITAGQFHIRAATRTHHDLALTCKWHAAYLKRMEPFPVCRT